MDETEDANGCERSANCQRHDSRLVFEKDESPCWCEDLYRSIAYAHRSTFLLL
jgi:hypothetical protein